MKMKNKLNNIIDNDIMIISTTLPIYLFQFNPPWVPLVDGTGIYIYADKVGHAMIYQA